MIAPCNVALLYFCVKVRCIMLATMLKPLTFTAIVAGVALSPLHAQNAAEGVIESAEEVVNGLAQAMEETGLDGAYISPPELVEFDSLQNKPADYPAASWVAGDEGTTYYELAIDADGNVADCTIIESSGHDALDTKTCEIAYERGEFVPAFDAAGEPVAGQHRDFQTWTRREPQLAGTSRIRVRYTLTAEGAVIDCEPVETTGYIGADMRRLMEREPCPDMSRANQPPYRDGAGNPVAKRVDLTIAVEVEDVAE